MKPIKSNLIYCGCLLLLQVTWSGCVAEALPYSEGTWVLTLLNDSQTETWEFSTNENVTVQFTDTQQHNSSKLKFSLYNYKQTTTYIKNKQMTETDHGNGSYTYTYTFNTGTHLSGLADWYYFKISSKSPNAFMGGLIKVGDSGSPHSFKTYSNSSYATEQTVFGNNETVYVEVIADAKTASIKTRKAVVRDYSNVVYLNKNVANLTQQDGVYHFSIDLNQAKKAFTTDWHYTLEVILKHHGESKNTIRAYHQIKVLPQAAKSNKTWNLIQWREVN